MNARGTARPGGSQAGFSLVEMLMTAVILAVGLLGLAMLQAVSLQSRGSSLNRTTALQVGGRVMEQVETEGRNTWLNLTDPSLAAPGNVPDLLYFAGGGQPNVTQYFDDQGWPLPSAAGSVFTTVTTGVAVANGSAQGGLSDVTVAVTFQEAAAGTSLVTHQVALTRRVLHG